jgi:endonuclease/exonuclease/phosphatase family metal-dependent hydrolase
MSLSFRTLSNHLGRSPSGSLRHMVARPSGPLKISVEAKPLSVLTHNMGLLVFPAPYLGTDRSGAIAEMIAQIRLLKPDVAGLCEVFANGERAEIRNAVKDLYPHWQDGPDEGDVESDGGLLVLSRHPLLATANMIFRQSDGWDRLANKGVIHIRVRPSGWPVPLDVFYSHTQDISTSNGVATLYAQLNAMNGFIATHADPALPRIIMGDLNIPGEQPHHYAQLLSRLGQPRDCWTLAGNPPDSGYTVITNSSFHADAGDRSSRNERLDYVLLEGSTRAVPILSDIQVLKLQRNGRYISDHFGLHASFARLAVMSP